MDKVTKGLFVRVHYTAILENGEVFDSTRGGEPIEVHVGQGEVIRGFEAALIDMRLNEKKVFTLSPEEAYGQRDESLLRSFRRRELPPGFNPQKGEIIALQSSDGTQIPALVSDADDEQITIDLNHPLAGKSLTFDIEVVGISDQPTIIEGCNCR